MQTSSGRKEQGLRIEEELMTVLTQLLMFYWNIWGAYSSTSRNTCLDVLSLVIISRNLLGLINTWVSHLSGKENHTAVRIYICSWMFYHCVAREESNAHNRLALGRKRRGIEVRGCSNRPFSLDIERNQHWGLHHAEFMLRNWELTRKSVYVTWYGHPSIHPSGRQGKSYV